MVAQLPHLASLASAHDRLALLIEVVLLGFRLFGFGCSTFATLLGFVIEEVAEVEMLQFEELVLELVCENIVVVLSILVVVLQNIRLQLVNRRVGREYLAGHLLKEQLFRSSESHITTNNNKVLAVRVNNQLSEVEHFGMACKAILQGFESILLNVSRVARESFNLSLVALQ